MKYVASWSGGKDSTATIILAHEHGEPLDEIVYVEVMFDKDTSGEVPEHIEFIHRAAAVFESWGYKVTRLAAEKTFMDIFNHVKKRGARAGMRSGFPMIGKCMVQTDCKMAPLRKWEKAHAAGVMQYIGIAADEPKRLARLTDGKESLLAKYGIEEAQATKICEKYGLLSPIYEWAKRGGCFFCPNARDTELRHLRTHHRDLYDRLLALENEKNTVGQKWRGNIGASLHEKEAQFQLEDNQITIFDLLEGGKHE